MRRFYTDPLAAAWMAKHFGMKIKCVMLSRLDNWSDAEDAIRYALSVHPELADVEGEKYYIHPDSLHLLEPQMGDIVFYDNLFGGEAWDEFKCMVMPDDDRYPYVGTGEPLMLMDSGEHPCRKELRRIIQRDGKPFFWPESEAA